MARDAQEDADRASASANPVRHVLESDGHAGARGAGPDRIGGGGARCGGTGAVELIRLDLKCWLGGAEPVLQGLGKGRRWRVVTARERGRSHCGIGQHGGDQDRQLDLAAMSVPRRRRKEMFSQPDTGAAYAVQGQRSFTCEASHSAGQLACRERI